MLDRLTLFSLILAVLGSCARNTETAGNDGGACSQTFITDYNAIVAARRDYQQYAQKPVPTLDAKIAGELVDKLLPVKIACDIFKSRHAGVSCRAEKLGQELIVSVSDSDRTCRMANAALERLNLKSVSRPSLPGPQASYPLLKGIKIKETTSNYKIVVLDDKKLLSLADKDQILVEQGEVYHPDSSEGVPDYLSFYFSKMICDVTAEDTSSKGDETNPKASPGSSTELTVMDYSEITIGVEPGKQRRFLELSFNETNLKIYCIKPESETDYTWSELQYTFSKIIEVKKIEPGATISSGSTHKVSF